jgi:hypothetical protein
MPAARKSDRGRCRHDFPCVDPAVVSAYPVPLLMTIIRYNLFIFVGADVIAQHGIAEVSP